MFKKIYAGNYIIKYNQQVLKNKNYYYIFKIPQRSRSFHNSDTNNMFYVFYDLIYHENSKFIGYPN